MNAGEIVSSIISGVAVLLLAGIARTIRHVTKDFKRFMAEHMWLIATTMWTRDKVIRIMSDLGMPLDNPPPDTLRGDKK